MESVDWQAFLDQHPELTKPTRIDFTDAELLEALRLAEAQRLCGKWRSRAKHPGVYTEEVGKAFTGDLDTDTGNCIRIGRALGRLARAGKVRKTKTYGSPLWIAV